jgi:hypothetical protein
MPKIAFKGWNLLFAALVLFFFALNADAQVISVGGVGSSTIGQDAWNSVKGLWFGPAGLILGVAIFGLSVYFFFKEGVLAVLGVLAVGTFFFFVPAMVVSVQNWARTF